MLQGGEDQEGLRRAPPVQLPPPQQRQQHRHDRRPAVAPRLHGEWPQRQPARQLEQRQAAAKPGVQEQLRGGKAGTEAAGRSKRPKTGPECSRQLGAGCSRVSAGVGGSSGQRVKGRAGGTRPRVKGRQGSGTGSCSYARGRGGCRRLSGPSLVWHTSAWVVWQLREGAGTAMMHASVGAAVS